MRAKLASIFKNRAMTTGKGAGLWRKFTYPQPDEWAEYLRRHGGFAAFGDRCAIDPTSFFSDPYLTRIGNNVRIAGGRFFGHDGSINMINAAFGKTLDNVGPITIGDDVFVGIGAIVLPNVTIASRVIVAAGAVVTRDVPSNSIVAGVPARVVGRLDDYVERVERRVEQWPWIDMVKSRGSSFDPAVEGQLRQMRVAHFFGDAADEVVRRWQKRRRVL